jgi:tetratricopeptide (TPR) repeat protein
MNVSRCVRAAENALKSYRQVICTSCGAATLSGSEFTFCSNCESVVGAESRSLESGDPSLFSLLNSIRTAVGKGDFESAGIVYDQLLKEKQSPQLLYASGLMQLEHSNYVVSQIRYDGDGFMEHNSELRVKGSLLVSDAKRLIAKSRSMSEKEAKEAPSAYVFYRMFLCDLKMGDLRSAGNCIAKIAEIEKDGAITSYARAVLDIQAGLYREADKELETLLKIQNPPANTFYYAAFNEFKLGDMRGTETLARASGGLIEESKRVNLLGALKEVES